MLGKAHSKETNSGFAIIEHIRLPVRVVHRSAAVMCPCHGGAYTKMGHRLGPPERGLFDIRTNTGRLGLDQSGELPRQETRETLLGQETKRCADRSESGRVDQAMQIAEPDGRGPRSIPAETRPVGVMCLEATPRCYPSATRHRNHDGI